jgi:galactonate dehydratase
MEIDIDRIAWDDELFTHLPEIKGGFLIIPDRPGWGTEPNEEALRAHPPIDQSWGHSGDAEQVAPAP